MMGDVKKSCISSQGKLLKGKIIYDYFESVLDLNTKKK